MPITTVSLTNTFDEWRIKTNQIVTALDDDSTGILRGNTTLTGSIVLTNPSKYSGNVTLNVSSGMIKGDGGLLSNVVAYNIANAAFDIANAAFSFANGTPTGSRVNVISGVANAAFDKANLAVSLATGDAPNSQVTIVYTLSNSAFDVANAAFAAANGSPSTSRVNVISGVANAGFNVANAAFGVTNAAFTLTNSSFTVANAAFAKANSSAVSLTDTTANATYYVPHTTSSSGNISGLTITTTKLYFNPSTGILASTAFNTLSDATLKDNFQDINDPLGILDRIKGLGFDWKDSGKHSYGVLAQDVEKVLPDLVDNSNGNKTVNYDGIIAVLIEAIKHLNAKLENK